MSTNGSNGSHSSRPETLPQYFLQNAQRYGESKVAIRQKEFGIWREYTWADSLENVRDLALGLASLGLERGQRVAIVGDNDRQYLWADIAIMAVGGVAVGIFTDSLAEEMEYVIDHSEAVIVMAKDQEQCDKILEIRDQLPNVTKVIYWDNKGMWYYEDPWLTSFDDVQKLGRERHNQNRDEFELLVAQGTGDEYTNFCYTSGTTGLPKGAMLTHKNFIAAAKYSGEIEPRFESDNVLSFAPLAWIAEHTLAVSPHCIYGITINFPESPETIQQNFREITPDVVFYPARLWENITAIVQVRISDSGWINRTLYNLFLPVGYKVADRRYAHEPVGPFLSLLYMLGELLVFKPLRGQLGLIKVRTALTAGAALSPDMLRFFRALGLNLKQVFATTETTGVGTQHQEADVNFDSVGVAIPGVKLQISDNGEIWVGGENIFHGYYKNPEATDRALSVDEDGMRWFHSGDAGYLNDEGHLIYLDRMKDMIELSSGEKYSPQFIEGRLKFSPYIRDVMSIGGEDKEFVSALIAIDFENVGRWAEKNRLTYTTYVDLSQRHEVYDLIRKDVDRVNQTLPEAAQVRRFLLLYKDFDADDAEMTRTRKLRRGYLLQHYQEMISALYNYDDEFKVTAPVKYRDGREGVVETACRIMTLDYHKQEVPA